MLSTEELLRKAVLSIGLDAPGDFGGVGQAPLSIEQVTEFIELMAAQQVMLSDVRTVTSDANKWQESILNFSSRVARPSVEGERLGASDRVKPVTGIVELSTEKIMAEIAVTDEVYEDNVAGAAFNASLERTAADRFGFDIEDLMVNGDTASSDTFLALFNGWFKQAQNAGQAVDATAFGQDYQEIFKILLQNLPDRFKRNLSSDFRFYVPKRTEEAFRDILSNRGTGAGDLFLLTDMKITYQSIPIVGVPALAITAGTPDKSKILLANHLNLYAGYHRKMRFETYRDPREGVTSLVISARVDAKVAVPTATAIAYNVDVEP